jgi:hypothetical protein
MPPSPENAMALMNWGASEIRAVHMHMDAHLWGPPAYPLIAKDSLLEIYILPKKHDGVPSSDGTSSSASSIAPALSSIHRFFWSHPRTGFIP